MVGAALGQDCFYDRSPAAQLASGLVEDDQMLHTSATLAVGIPVAAPEGGAAVANGWGEHLVDALIQAFDFGAAECVHLPVRPHTAMRTDFVGDIVAGAREERLIKQGDFYHALRIFQQGRREIRLREERREQVMPELAQFSRRLFCRIEIHVAETTGVYIGQVADAGVGLPLKFQVGVFFGDAGRGDQPGTRHTEVAQQPAAIIEPEVEQLPGALDVGDRTACQAGQGGVDNGVCDAAAPHPDNTKGHVAVELILDGFDFGKLGHAGAFASKRLRMQSSIRRPPILPKTAIRPASKVGSVSGGGGL